MKRNKNRWEYTLPGELKSFKRDILTISATMIFALLMLRESAEIFARMFSKAFTDYYRYAETRRDNIVDLENDVLNAYNDLIMIAATIFTLVLVSLILRKISNRAMEKRGEAQGMGMKITFPAGTIKYAAISLGAFYTFYYISEYILIGAAGIIEFDRAMPPEIGFPSTVPGIILHIMATAAVPAIFEELTFRYYLLNALKRYGNTYAIITSAVYFGLLHASYNAFFYATAFGIVAAHMALRAKSIILPIIVHFAINFSSIIFRFTYYAAGEKAADITYTIYLSIIFLVFMGAVIHESRKTKSIILPEERNWVCIPLKTKVIWFFNIAAVVFIAISMYYSLEEFVL